MVYLHQTKLRLLLESGHDLTSAESVNICYRKPSGSEGSWVATVLDVAKGSVCYDVSPPTLLEPDVYTIDEVGTWTVWIKIKFTDGRVLPGDPLSMVVYKEGSKEVRK